MKIYFAHPNTVDYRNELYRPLLASALAGQHELIFPHLNFETPFDSKDLLTGKGCDLMVAEVSMPALGVGIELGWADSSGIPIVCIHKAGTRIGSSLKVVTGEFIEYTGTDDLISKLTARFHE